LEVAITAMRRPAEDQRRNSHSDPTLAAREPRLGALRSTENFEAWFCCCGAESGAYLQPIRRRGNPAGRWLTFLQNHREVIAAFDFFTVPTVTFQLLYCVFVIEHGRRRILHFNVTRHPTAEWVVQQLREAFPETGQHRYVIFDRDSTFNNEVVTFLKATGLEPKRTSIQAPWQNGSRSDGWELPSRDPRPRHRAE
jgi:hypothetical protein